MFGWVNGKNPRQHGFDFGLWTRQVVRELIEKKFAARLSLASVGTLLARLGLSPQKPLQHAYQRDPLAVTQWEKQTYPAIVTHAKREKAEIYFWDASGFRADAVQGRTWAVKGVTRLSRCRGSARASVRPRREQQGRVLVRRVQRRLER